MSPSTHNHHFGLRAGEGYLSSDAGLESLGQAERLTGRDEDLRLIHSFLADAAARGGALLLSGEPGVGKTTLLEAASSAATAAGTQLVRAAGAEFEADVSFSGLN